MKKTLVFLVAETGAGKDTVANKLPYPKVVSYKTGPLRDSDIQGVTHNFISDELMDELEYRSDMIAYTNTGGIRYCATTDQLEGDISIYIINPDGVRWFNEHYKGPELHVIVIGLYLPFEIRKERCILRGDNLNIFEKRVLDEQADYDKFRLNGEFDYMIKNIDSNKTACVIYDIIQHELIYQNSIITRV